MKPFSQPLHPLFQQINVGSEVWWNTVKKLGSPLVNLQKNKALCTFIWRSSELKESLFVYIDIYSQSPSIYQKWNRFSRIAGTDVYFFEIELPLAWAGSYVVVTASEEAPETDCAATRRAWWQTQLKQSAQIDPFNQHRFYTGHLARYINQIQLESTKFLIGDYPITKTFQWSSRLCQQDYLVDVFISHQSTQEDLPLIILLDGQLWSRELSIIPEIQHLTDSNKIRPAVYVFVHSLNSQQRQQDYGCHDAFSQALVYELIETLLKEYSFISKIDITLCGQSLGGLCALHSALLFPTIFTSLILQSGSYWWSDFSNSTLGQKYKGNILELLQNRSHPLSKTTQIYISAGTYETDMRDDALQLYQQLQSFNQVSFHSFSGGHDAVNWRTDLLKALQKILSL
ncbi:MULTISPECIES: enterochelin esterase [Acinetobacter]|jgi:enterochelin esterase family protein|uniref:Enterochelin esterase n=1 Tax=Acinetobacter pittii TaxID=48296 RepID=A0A242U8V3_ACIPI|nr:MULTISPECIES: enterochelin esterase [Acinetobacter]EXS22532.1 esterase family protein [Acinetobacter baumannii 573719]MBJ8470750.1 enterochelin esterase [Acinetobacter pittii]MBJ8500610.1 enterochelin esterase [Acinetobacter pittii]MBJ9892957.1 enterochelin esterase [Acinetobacter pittii]MCU4478523.1 enterochelin esterase [Acinetobacter sp. WU_MDCI_Abxd143]